MILFSIFVCKALKKKHRHGTYCTMPVFGFKAKRAVCADGGKPDCTMPVFGAKSKLEAGD